MTNCTDSSKPATLDLKLIEPALTTYVVGRAENHLLDETDSTNTRATQLAGTGSPEGTVVLARQQSAGRGRQGRTWVSPPEAGIYMSVVLRPQLPIDELPLLSLMTGVACAEAIERVTGVKIGLKWVNDLVFEGRKLGGILVEMGAVPSGPSNRSELAPAVVIGTGVNMRFDRSQIPDELTDKIEWIERLCGRKIDSNTLVAEICNCLEAQYLELKQGLRLQLIDKWKSYSVTLGRDVIADSGNRQIHGHAIDIDRSGALIIRKPDGEEVSVYGGEVSVRLSNGRYA